jgi:hypothetical protein
MTAISWSSSAGSGLWQMASNWSPAQVPGTSDTATIGVAGVITVTSNADVTVGTTIVDANMTLAIDSNTTFHTTDGSTQAQGAIKVNNGGTFELGKDSTSTTFTNVGNVNLEGGSATTDVTIAGNITVSGGAGNSEIRADHNQTASAGFIIAGDGVGSPTLTLASSEAIGTLGGTTVISALTLTLETNASIFANFGTAIIATGTNTVTNDGGKLEAAGSGELFIDSPVNNASGFIDAGGGDFGFEGGTVVISAAVTGASSTVEIDGYGVLELASGGSVASVVQLHGTGNTLRLDTGTSQVAAGISGAVVGDNFDLAFQPFAAGDHAAWTQTSGSGGALSLLDGSNATLATLSLSGQYTSANFAAASDGHGGTLVEVVTPPPAPGTTVDMIMSRGAGGTDFNAISNTDYEIYDIGGNAFTAGNPLQLVASNFQTAGPYFDSPTANYQVVGLGGFNGTDTSDVLLRDLGSDPNSGAFGVFDLAANNASGGALLGAVGLNFQFGGLGDFSSNPSETDMILRSSSTGAFEVYDIAANAITNAAAMGTVGLNWTIAGFGDFSGTANETDMLLRDSSTGAFEVYDISHNAITSAASMGAVGLNWTVAGFGDFSGNANETDMLLRNSSTGAFEVYDISHNAITSAASMGAVGLNFTVAGFGDFSGNPNETDMLLRNSSTGQFEVYDIAHNAIVSASSMGAVGLDWQVSGIAADPPTGSFASMDNKSSQLGTASATSQLVQAMAGFGGGSGATDNLNTAPLGADTSQQLLTTPQHA